MSLVLNDFAGWCRLCSWARSLVSKKSEFYGSASAELVKSETVAKTRWRAPGGVTCPAPKTQSSDLQEEVRAGRTFVPGSVFLLEASQEQ